MKNIFKTGLFALAAMFLYSCQDSLEVVEPTLEIHFAEDGDEGYIDYTINSDGALHCSVDDIVTIMISGEMDILYRYSGEAGQQYFTEDDVVCNWGGDCTIQFASRSTTASSGTATHTNVFTTESTTYYTYQDNLAETLTTSNEYGYSNPKLLTMYISKDFSGVKDSLNIMSATWVEVPDELVGWPTTAALTTTNLIDVEDIKDPADSSQPYLDINSDYFYIAYRYKSDPCVRTPTAYAINTETGLYDTTYSNTNWGSTWMVRNMDVRRTYEDGRYQYFGLKDLYTTANDYSGTIIYAGFTMGVSMYQEGCVDSVENTWACAAATTTFTPTKTEDYAYVWDDDWVVSKKFDMTLVPKDDTATALKTTTADVPTSTNLSYSAAGTYTFSMIAANVTVEDRKEVLRQLTIIVE